VFDLGYLGVENDFPERLSFLRKRKKKRNEEGRYMRKKKSTTEFILKRE